MYKDSVCTRILCGHGGVGLATSLLQSASEEQGPSQPGTQASPWCATVGQWTHLQSMFAAVKANASLDMRSSA